MTWLGRLGSALAVTAITLVLAVGPASAQATVQGSIRFDATSIPMTHVYARETRPSPTSNDPPQILILMTDRPAPADVIASRRAYYTAAREGRIHGFMIELQPSSDRARFAIFAPGGASDERSLPDPFTGTQLTNLVKTRELVSASLKTTEPRELDRDADTPEEPATYEIDVTFRVPVTPAPRPTATLDGEEARRSEQAAAALDALKLIRSSSPAEIRARLHPSHPIWNDMASDQAAAILAVAREVFPDPSTFLASVQRVIVYGDEAVVVARDSEGSGTVSLRRDAGTWKLADSPIPND